MSESKGDLRKLHKDYGLGVGISEDDFVAKVKELFLELIGGNERLSCDCGSDSCGDWRGDYVGNCVRDELREKVKAL